MAIQYNTSHSNVTVKKIFSNHPSVKFKVFKFDFKKQKLRSFFNKIKDEFGEIDILINNASAFEFDSIKQTSNEIFDTHIDKFKSSIFFIKILC